MTWVVREGGEGIFGVSSGVAVWCLVGWQVAVSTARAVDKGEGNGAAAGSAAAPRVLEGLPVSIKDSINMAGATTRGAWGSR